MAYVVWGKGAICTFKSGATGKYLLCLGLGLLYRAFIAKKSTQPKH